MIRKIFIITLLALGISIAYAQQHPVDLRLTIYSKNYGTYKTSPDGKMYEGENTEALYGIFPVTDQFSAFLQAKKNLKKGIQIGIMSGLDSGGLYNDAFGMMGMVSKAF